MLTKSSVSRLQRTRAEKEELLAVQNQREIDTQIGRKYLAMARQSSLANRHGLRGMTEDAYQVLERLGVDTSDLPLDVDGESGMYLLETEQVDVLFAVESAGSYEIETPNGRQLSPWAQRLLELVETGRYHAVVAGRFDRLSRDETIGAALRDALRRHRVTFYSKNATIEPWTQEGATTFKVHNFVSDMDKASIVDRTKNGQVKAMNNGFWPLASPPPHGIRLERVKHETTYLNRATWDEDGLRTVAAVIKDTAAGRGAREVARLHLIGTKMLKGPGLITRASQTTDGLVRKICVDWRPLYEMGSYRTIFRINGTYAEATLSLPSPAGLFDFMPTPAEFESAYHATMNRRSKRTSVSSSPVVGLFRCSWNGELLAMKSEFLGGTRRLVARDSEGAVILQVEAAELEGDLFSRLVPALTAILDGDDELLEAKAAHRDDSEVRVRRAIEDLEAKLRRVLEEKLGTTSADSLAFLSARQRQMEDDLHHLRLKLSAAGGPPRATDRSAARDLLDAVRDGGNRAEVRELARLIVHGAEMSVDGSWKATIYWLRDGTTYGHEVDGRVVNRARRVGGKKRNRGKKDDPAVDLWMRGNDLPAIVKIMKERGAEVSAESLLDHYLRPVLGGPLATCTNPVVLTVARGLLLGDMAAVDAHGSIWADRVREVHFDAAGQPRTDGRRPAWGNWHSDPPEWKRDLAALLVNQGGSVSADDAARHLGLSIGTLRSRLARWTRNYDAVPIESTRDGRITFRKCPHCGEARPIQLAIPEPRGPVCTSCRRDRSGLEFGPSFDGVDGIGHPLG